MDKQPPQTEDREMRVDILHWSIKSPPSLSLYDNPAPARIKQCLSDRLPKPQLQIIVSHITIMDAHLQVRYEQSLQCPGLQLFGVKSDTPAQSSNRCALAMTSVNRLRWRQKTSSVHSTTPSDLCYARFVFIHVVTFCGAAHSSS